MKNLDNEQEYHNKRVEEESDGDQRLGFVYKSMSNALNIPAEGIPSGKSSILEVGCYMGENTFNVPSSSSYVGIDISDAAIEHANKHFSQDNLQFKCFDAHKIDELEVGFDYVFGNGILHHLDLDTFINALKQSLNSSGSAVFLEPMEGPFWLRLFRKITPSLRTEDEHPLTDEDLIGFSEHFTIEKNFYGLLCPAIPMIFLNNKYVVSVCQKLDQILSKTFLNKFYWMVVVKFSLKDV